MGSTAGFSHQDLWSKASWKLFWVKAQKRSASMPNPPNSHCASDQSTTQGTALDREWATQHVPTAMSGEDSLPCLSLPQPAVREPQARLSWLQEPLKIPGSPGSSSQDSGRNQGGTRSNQTAPMLPVWGEAAGWNQEQTVNLTQKHRFLHCFAFLLCRMETAFADALTVSLCSQAAPLASCLSISHSSSLFWLWRNTRGKAGTQCDLSCTLELLNPSNSKQNTWCQLMTYNKKHSACSWEPPLFSRI